MSNNISTTRRQYVKTLTTGAIGTAAVSGAHSVAAQADSEVVYEQDFESLSSGAYPSDWTKDGNDNQQVVTADSASGSKCLEQRGALGGCWQALANAPVTFPAEYSVRIAGAVKPLEEGSYGCHDKYRCYLSIRTDVGSWSAGKGYRLLNFKPDGTVRGRTGDDTVLGSYTVGEWNRFAIGYRPRESETEFTFRINGEESGPFTLDPAGFESDLSYLKFASGDFVTQWDDISVTRLPVEVSPLQQQSSDGDSRTDGAKQNDSDDSGIPILNRFADSSESQWLLLLGLLGGSGGYAWHRRRSGLNEPVKAQNQGRQAGQQVDAQYDTGSEPESSPQASRSTDEVETDSTTRRQ